MEDYNTATLPHRKFYDLLAHHREEQLRAAREGREGGRREVDFGNLEGQRKADVAQMMQQDVRPPPPPPPAHAPAPPPPPALASHALACGSPTRLAPLPAQEAEKRKRLLEHMMLTGKLDGLKCAPQLRSFFLFFCDLRPCAAPRPARAAVRRGRRRAERAARAKARRSPQGARAAQVRAEDGRERRRVPFRAAAAAARPSASLLPHAPASTGDAPGTRAAAGAF